MTLPAPTATLDPVNTSTAIVVAGAIIAFALFAAITGADSPAPAAPQLPAQQEVDAGQLREQIRDDLVFQSCRDRGGTVFHCRAEVVREGWRR